MLSKSVSFTDKFNLEVCRNKVARRDDTAIFDILTIFRSRDDSTEQLRK